MIARSLRTALYEAALEAQAAAAEIVIRTIVLDDGNPERFNLVTAAGTREQLDDLERDVREQVTALGEVIGVLDGVDELIAFQSRGRGAGRA